MNQSQREHIATVMASLSNKAHLLAPRFHEQTIRDSWQRCVEHHGLDPRRMQEARILPWHELREHRQEMEEFRHIAHHGLTVLYQQIAAAGYVVLLTDARGITVDYLGDANAEISLRRAGLFLGAQWTEACAGTCAVGTALATGKALTVHQADHFDATHIPLTCTAVPLFDPQGQLNAILDISALSSPQPKSSQQLALQLAKIYAHQIENAWFEHRHRGDWVLKLSPASSFVEVSPDFLIAFDAAGKVVGHNHRAQRMLENELGIAAPPVHCRSTLLGWPIEQLFNTSIDSLPDWLASASGQQGTLERARSGEKLYVTAVQPVRRAPRKAAASQGALPPALAALNGGDAALQLQLQRAARLLEAPLHLMVHGETGCGKEFFAKAFHQASNRRHRAFVAVNCAAIPAALIESELFGHLPGSFSGAGSKGRRGLIQEADGGTLFLDEIGDMPLEMQTRLLRVLAEQEVLPVGASRPVSVDIRVISASHHALDQLVQEGRFRADLFYRLQGARISLPALRQRSDLDWLVDKLLAGKAQLSAAARRRLHQHRWPGNLRELSNALDYAAALCDGGRIEATDLPEGLTAAIPASPLPMVNAEADAALPPEAQLLIQYLRAARWNHSAVARQMGISRMTLYRRMQRFGIQSPVHD
ncbi:sigma-54-dependent Fis family transcriptional regulator [Serratia plymuthica]|uniref:Sigma-54-dependent Fis family transcriptional regulator n=1 Tax=Serratia plymuthica TaxID=82996 RepID=A0A318P3K6_SERPL|nr:sigma-54-dependent Fis family transcriptional regulator [Serratia plymuthica]AGO55903.1 acetoin catabolism regulatory protein AcoR [Serratia plymuthica 4Rx13]MBL3525746.1 sigma-54-dependent Fis family transcriptional regulator [Serratia plymuthica]PYD40699.1 sigma-54-dependent Fis family transcriptional regulator [Serratia plymuthica]